jgi:hypothetical protein
MDDGVFAKEDYFARSRDEEGIHRGWSGAETGIPVGTLDRGQGGRRWSGCTINEWELQNKAENAQNEKKEGGKQKRGQDEIKVSDWPPIVANLQAIPRIIRKSVFWGINISRLSLIVDIARMTSSSSFKQFSLENDMEDVTTDTAAMDSIYEHNVEEQRTLLAAKPWAAEFPPSHNRFLTV